MKDLQSINKDIQLMPINPQTLISQAIDKNLPIETMERLLVMRRELKQEKAKDEYFNDLSNFQKECPTIEKKKKVYSKKTNKVRYKYAPIDDIVFQVRDLLQKYGFSYIVKTKQEKNVVTAICEAHHKSGHSENTEISIPVDKDSYMNIAQQVASALTFAKRYAFCNAFGIMTGDQDDDSNGMNDKITTSPNGNYNKQINENKYKKEEESLSQDNKNLYKICLELINRSESGMNIYTGQQKILHKKHLDAVVMKIEDLRKFHKVLNGLTQDKINKITGGNDAS